MKSDSNPDGCGEGTELPASQSLHIQGRGDGEDLYHLDKSQCKSFHVDGRELVSYRYKAISFLITLKNFVFLKGSFGFGQKVLQEFLTQEPKKIMLLGPGTDSLAKSVAAYAGIPEVGLLQVCRTQRFVAH